MPLYQPDRSATPVSDVRSTRVPFSLRNSLIGPHSVRHEQVDPAVLIDVRPQRAGHQTGVAQTLGDFGGRVAELSAVVAQQVALGSEGITPGNDPPADEQI